MQLSLFDAPVMAEIKSQPRLYVKPGKAETDAAEPPKFKSPTAKERRLANEKAQDLLARILAERTYPTPEEKEVLRAYSGEGGIGENATQYFTPEWLTSFTWKCVKALGFEGGLTLEPAAGVGAFMQYSRSAMGDFIAVELDKTCADIAKMLYPKAKVHNESFEEFFQRSSNMHQRERFSLIIGNVPFGRRGGTIGLDKPMMGLKWHEQYFISRGLELLKPGGIMALIVPAGVNNNKSYSLWRQSITTKGGVFLGAFRFGEGAFLEAGARVTTDLLLMSRGIEKDHLRQAAFENGEWFDTLGQAWVFGDVVDEGGRWGKETVMGGKPDFRQRNEALKLLSPIQAPAQIRTEEPQKQAATKVRDTVFESIVAHARTTGKNIQALLEAQKAGADLGEPRRKALEALTVFLEYRKGPYWAKLKPLAKEDRAIACLLGSVVDGKPADFFFENTFHTVAQVSNLSLPEAVSEYLRKTLADSFKAQDIAPLMGCTEEEAEKALIGAKGEYLIITPGTWATNEMYFTGDLYEKRDKLNQALLWTKGNIWEPIFKAQLAELQAKIDTLYVKLHSVPISIRDTWIPLEVKNQFLDYDQRVDSPFSWGRLRYNEETKLFENAKRGTNARLLEKYINHLGIGSSGDTRVMRETDLADLEQEFRDWLLNSRHTTALEQDYNRRFNGFLQPEYSQEPIQIPRFNFSLHGYQYQNMRKLIFMGRGINAMDVGLGKTLTTIATALKLKDIGRTKKPAIVVPKSVLSNWKKELERSTEGLKVLYIGEKFSPDGRSTTMSAQEREIALQLCAQNNWDLVFFTDSAFQTIPLSPEIIANYSSNEFADQVFGKEMTAYRRAKARDSHEAKVALREFLNLSKVTFFDDLGIDCLFLDEASSIKNMHGSKQQSRVRFLPTGDGAKRSHDFNSKARYILERNGHKNVFLLTATPTKNSPLEAYNMLNHIAPEEMKKRGILNIEHFIDHYGRVEARTIPNTAGEFEEVQALVGFKHLGNLRKFMFAFTDMRNAVEVGLPLPKREPIIMLSDLSPEQEKDYQRLRHLAAGGLNEHGQEEHIFRVIHKMENVCFDPTLEDPDRYADMQISPKMEQVCQTVMGELGQGRGGQIIFTNDKFVKSHQVIAQRLTELGLPAEQIGVINGNTCPKSSDRQRACDKFNSGQYKVVIGNDGIIGQGVNLQEDTAGIHHASLPWTPADMVQRDGRGLRQGNKQDTVRIFTYFSKGSFDAIRHECLDRKSDWIGELWRGTADDYLNAAADTKGGIDPAELQILLAPDPELARKQWNENKEIALQAIDDKHKAQMYLGYRRIVRNLRKMQSMPPESFEYKRMYQYILKLKRTLHESKHFTHKDWLMDLKSCRVDEGREFLVNQETHQVFIKYETFSALMAVDSHTESGADGGPKLVRVHFLVNRVNEKYKTIEGRMFSNKNRNDITFPTKAQKLAKAQASNISSKDRMLIYNEPNQNKELAFLPEWRG